MVASTTEPPLLVEPWACALNDTPDRVQVNMRPVIREIFFDFKIVFLWGWLKNQFDVPQIDSVKLSNVFSACPSWVLRCTRYRLCGPAGTLVLPG